MTEAYLERLREFGLYCQKEIRSGKKHGRRDFLIAESKECSSFKIVQC